MSVCQPYDKHRTASTVSCILLSACRVASVYVGPVLDSEQIYRLRRSDNAGHDRANQSELE